MLKKITIALCIASIGVMSSFAIAQNHTKRMQNGMNMPASKNTPVMVTPNDITWMAGPDIFPSGAQIVVLEGNPKSSGMYTVRLKLPANYQIGPHYMTTPQRITVISGTLNTGTGDKMDTSGGTALAAGSFMSVPANLHHYLWTTDETVIQVSGQGPLMIKYVNPTDDPRKSGTATQPMSTTPGTSPTTGPSTPSTAPMNGGTTTPSSTTTTPMNGTTPSTSPSTSY